MEGQKMAKGQKPGLILYHEDLHALEGMDGETFKTVILSLLSLSETGVDSNPGGMAGVAYAFMSRKVREDNDSYQTTVEKRKAAVNARWGKPTPEQPEKSADVPEQIHVNTNEYMCMHVNTNDTQQQPQQKPQQKQKLQQEQEDIYTPGASAPADPPHKKTIRHQYGQYKNVLLTDADLETLKEEFPADWAEWIERLSEYIASKGAKYKNHLATIRAWARKDQPVQKKLKYANAGTFV